MTTELRSKLRSQSLPLEEKRTVCGKPDVDIGLALYDFRDDGGNACLQFPNVPRVLPEKIERHSV